MTKPKKGSAGKPQKSATGQVGTCDCDCGGVVPPYYNDSCCGDCNDGQDNFPASLDVTFSGITNCGTKTTFTTLPPATYPLCDITETPNDLQLPCSDLHDTTFNCAAEFVGEPASNLCSYSFLGTDEPHCRLLHTLESVSLGKIKVRATISGGGGVTVTGNTHSSYDSVGWTWLDICFYGSESITVVSEECTVCESMPITVNNGYDSGDCDQSYTNGGYGGTATVDRG